MHEASVVEALVSMLALEVEKQGGGRVTVVRLVVGEATGYMPESLDFYFGQLSKGTSLEGARLEYRTVKALLCCQACGREFERARFTFECPDCGGQGQMTAIGRDFHVESIDLEAAQPDSGTS
ncbi:MAG: hydrogenase maturation nickel metallochaperone HypA [Spirochaetota bacterium]